MGRLFCLLVGIDDYPASVSSLQGCVADVAGADVVLGTRFPDSERRLLTNGEATRAGVLAAWKEHLGRAGPGDTALFWYAGHGSQQATTRRAGSPPDGKDQTLVLHDSRSPGSWDLLDRELGGLVTGLADQGAHVVVVLDSCHSGSGTRDPFVTARRAPEDPRIRTVGDEAPAERSEDEAGWALGVGRHVLLAAARSQQTAKEVTVDGARRGAFSHALQACLAESDELPSYATLIQLTRNRVAALVTDQAPQLEASTEQDARQTFLGGGVRDDGRHRPLVHPRGDAWYVDAGSLNAVRKDGTTVAIFESPDSEVALDAVGTVVEVEATRSRLAFPGPGLDRTREYWGVLTGVTTASLAVWLDDPTAELGDLVAASGLLTSVDREEAQAEATRSGQGFRVLDRRAPERPPVESSTPALAVRVLERMATWYQVLALDNPASRLDRSKLVMELEKVNPDGTTEVLSGDTVQLPYVDGAPQQFRIRLSNRTSAPVFATLLSLDPRYGISTELVPGHVVRLAADDASPFVAADGMAVAAVVPDDLWQEGHLSRTDVVKVVFSTVEPDWVSLVQDALGPEGAGTDTATPAVVASATRELVVSARPATDWITASVQITAHREPATKRLDTTSTRLSPRLTVEGHPGFTAEVRLRAASGIERSTDPSVIPPGWQELGELGEPFSLTDADGRAVEAADVLELVDVEGADQVDTAHPLRLRLDVPLEDGAGLLVVGQSDGVFLPVGWSNGPDEVVIERIPEAIGIRGLGGAVRLLVRKLVRRWVGAQDDTVRLALPRVVGDEVVYDDDVATIRSAVESAESVVVLVHGIIGDTRGMVLCGQSPPGSGLPAVWSPYDVVLSVDYENLDTPVPQTAAALHAKLTAVGVTPDRRVDVVAHSMGGLVTRWMVELLDAPPVVDRVIMLGTPNGGSPWPKVQDLAWTLMTFGLNKLGAAAWPAWVFGGLLGVVERLDTALDDMGPGSAVLQQLAAAPDPGIPYHLIVGDTDLIGPRQRARLAEVLPKLGRRAANAVFFGMDNDLAVAVESAQNLPAGRTPALASQVVACDHVTYFQTPAGLLPLAGLTGAAPDGAAPDGDGA